MSRDDLAHAITPTAHPPSAPVRPSRVRYQVLAVACSLALLTYVHRLGFVAAAPQIARGLGLSDAYMGYLMSAFLVAYALFQMPGGLLGDSFGARHLLTFLVLGWSLLTGAVALVADLPAVGLLPFVVLLILRFLFGMFQAGEVDYLVATDAIGMGLNMDVDHVAFAGLAKFDGNRRRRLTPAEMAQIAGRAGRHQRDGTFGSLTLEGDALAEFRPEEIERIEEHRFDPLDHLYWRESALDYDNVEALIRALERRPVRPLLEEFVLSDGRRLVVVAAGRLVNLGSAEGHPAAVMDMSFANQALAAEWLAGHARSLDARVYPVPPEIDREIARLKLESMGVRIDALSDTQEEYLRSWTTGT